MIVCICKGISERIVRGAIRQGATTVAAVGRNCGAGTVCGSCRSELKDMLDEGCIGSTGLAGGVRRRARSQT